MTKAIARLVFVVLLLGAGYQVFQTSPKTPAGTRAATVATSSSHHHKRHHKAATASSPTAAISPSGYSLYIEPQAGFGPVYRFIANATSSLDMVMYELVDTQAEQALAAAAGRGVDVHVILDNLFEKTRNSPAYDYLQAHGVHVTWSSSLYEFTHEKALEADGRRMMILSANLTSRYYPTTRDVLVSYSSATDAAAFTQVFNADYAGQTVLPGTGTGDLVWSPGSEPALLSVISGASHTLVVENEEMADPTITNALIAAAKRGVDVTVVMTANSDYNQAFTSLAAAGVHVDTYPDSTSALYIHAKIEVADVGTPQARTYVGSINYSYTSTHRNRELGIITSDKQVAATLAAVVQSDAAAAT